MNMNIYTAMDQIIVTILCHFIVLEEKTLKYLYCEIPFGGTASEPQGLLF